MPSQSVAKATAWYVEGDTAPTLRRRLEDGNGDPIDLTGCTVTIRIAHASYDHYYSPGTVIVDDQACTPDPDQVTNKGYVEWDPPVDALSPAGSYEFTYRVTYSGGGVETVPQDAPVAMIIRPRVGGNA